MKSNIRIYLYLSFIFVVPSVSAQEQPEYFHLNLKQALVLASKQNTQVLAANQRVLQALANISVNNAALFPQLS